MRNYRLYPSWLHSLFVIVLILGICFRFANLDSKVYWFDETYTSMRVAGYTEAEVIQQLSFNQEIGIRDLQKYQRISPEKDLTDTLRSLAVEDPQHPPLYYILNWFWARSFGNSVAMTRSLTALLSLLVFPCIYWLCLELFESALVGWIAMALIAVSPLHLALAQDAREYCLWTVTTLLSSAALLRAIRIKTHLSWGIYAVTVVVGLYTFLLSGLVILGHAIYTFATVGFRSSRTVVAYCLALLAGIFSFLPWMLVVVVGTNQIRMTTQWSTNKTSLLFLVKQQAAFLSWIFFDPGFRAGHRLEYLMIPSAIILPLLVGYAVYFLGRRAKKQSYFFILTLASTVTLPLLVPDLLLGGHRSGIRYLIPFYLCIHLTIAYLFARQISGISVKNWRQRQWQIVMIVLFLFGILSCVIYTQSETWRNKYLSYYDPQIARIINHAAYPLLISDARVADILPLSYLLDSKVRLRIKPQCYTSCLTARFATVKSSPLIKIPRGFSNIFVLRPSKDLLNKLKLEQSSKLEPAFNEPIGKGSLQTVLWELKKK
jgi:uncharacterized membrane protein